MMITGKNITKEYGSVVVLDQISFHVNQGDRVGLVGSNGAGKTTLLKIIAGEIPLSSGTLLVRQGKKVGFLKQQEAFGPEETPLTAAEKIFRPLKEMERQMSRMEQAVASEESPEKLQQWTEEYDFLLARFKEQGGYTYPGEIQGVLKGMGFGPKEQNKRIAGFSGGEKTRLALALLLLKKPDILLLDEPTNHLDIGTLKWLEQYLQGVDATMIVVSHDRYFLDKISTKIMEVEHQRLNTYAGNYSEFTQKKKQLMEEQRRRIKKQNKEIKKEEELIRRFKSHGTEKLAKRAASREKKLEKITLESWELVPVNQVKLKFSPEFKSGKEVMKAQALEKFFGYGTHKKQLFSQVEFQILRGEKIGMVGANGIGKTTLMKIIMGELKPNGGTLCRGHHVTFGYYDQEQEGLNPAHTVFEEIESLDRGYSNPEIRKLLGQFLFLGESVFLPVASLSGGEKARLALLKLMIGGANVLLLDEPTNHLDIQSKEVVEEALRAFPGTVLAVSHDRYFLNRVPTKIYELNTQGLRVFQGDYDYYQEKKNTVESAQRYVKELAQKEEETEQKEKSSALLRKEKKEWERKERRATREKKKLEEAIELLEKSVAQKEEKMCCLASEGNLEELVRLEKETREEKEKLEGAYEKWLQYDR